MSIMNPVLPNTSAEVARIAFSLFVYVADIDRNITAQEVRRFQVLLNDTAWVENDDLRAGLQELKDRYSTFWANYEDGVFSADVQAIAEAMERIRRYVGEERAKALKVALGRFLVLLDRGSFGGKLGQKDNPARVQAKKELAAILLGGGLPALPAPAADSARMPQPFPPRLVSPPPAATAELPVAEARTSSPQPASPAVPAQMPESGDQPGPVAPAANPHPRPDECTVWSGRTRLYCVSVAAETHDTKTYSFVGEPGTLFHYRPGQAITIEVPVQGSVLRRTYTISSSPSRPYLLSITVKKVPMGWMSNWLFDNMVPGVECMANGPFGKFTCLEHSVRKLLFLAAGSGVTPLMSMLRWLADMARDVDVVFIYNVSTPADIIFHQELLHLATRFGSRLRLVIVPAAPAIGFPWHGSMGRIDEMLIRSQVADLAEREAFVCGPAGYMAAARSILISLGLPEELYHQEAFGAAKAETAAVRALPPSQGGVAAVAPATAPAVPAPPAIGKPEPAGSLPAPARPAPPPAPAARKPASPAAPAGSGAAPETAARAASPSAAPPATAGAGKPQVTIESSGERFAVRPDQTILDAADEAGIHLEHSCRAGSCGSCKMRAVSGEVRMEPGHCLSADEVGAGYILTCVARPAGSGNVTIVA